jgi:hypothetical protein
MKVLPYSNLSTYIESRAGVIFEGDTEVNCSFGLYLKKQISLHNLRAGISYEHWFT